MVLLILRLRITFIAKNNVLNRMTSSYLDIVMGSPQGSILDPVLLSLTINDLPNSFANYHCYLFADDTLIYSD